MYSILFNEITYRAFKQSVSVLLGLEEAQIQRSITSVRKALMNDFVPLHLGFERISHDEFCRRHTTETASKLFGTNINDAITVLDGTYIYIQKSADYSFQRRSYSIHKNRPLLKPMMIVGTDGYILDVIGPYFADYHNNDAAITKHLLLTNNSAKNLFQENDILIVDRFPRCCRFSRRRRVQGQDAILSQKRIKATFNRGS